VSRRTFILHCDVHRLLYTVMYPLCICVAPPFGFLIYTFYLSKKKKILRVASCISLSRAIAKESICDGKQ
jgi:hypothetical protein